MGLASLFGVIVGVMTMAACSMRVVSCFFVLATLIMFSCFPVVASGLGVVFCCLLVVFGCFLGHGRFPLFNPPLQHRTSTGSGTFLYVVRQPSRLKKIGLGGPPRPEP
ncbi:hypothetical protein AC629_42620 [Bradyrhizobium sp. NAS80.1]|nr:hypothetical protein AC629_42620 [Bradyrhizobium sp. NAS80.1]